MRYVIKVATNWVGEEEFFGIEADSIEDIDDMADEIASQSFESWEHTNEIFEENGLLTSVDLDWNVYDEIKSKYYNYSIYNFEGTDEEWNKIVCN